MKSGVSLECEDVNPFMPKNLCLGKPYGWIHGLFLVMVFVFSFLCYYGERNGLGNWVVVGMNTLREGGFIHGSPKVMGPGGEGWI